MKFKQWCKHCGKMTNHNSGGCAEHTIGYYYTARASNPTCEHTKAKQNNYNYCPDCGERMER